MDEFPSQAGVATVDARPWFKKKRFMIPAALIVLGTAFSALSGGDEAPTNSTGTQKSQTLVSSDPTTSATATPTPKAASPAAAPATKAPAPTKAPAATKSAAPKPAPPKAPALSVEQENAVEQAESYLDLSGFSQKGLIDQLKFEGFSEKDAKAALATMKVDWNQEAAQSAESYMDISSFSRKGLIEQLEFDGFTSKQARHGAAAVGL